MNIYLQELKARLGSVLTWSIAIAALITLFMTLFKGFSADTALLQEAMARFPKELLIAFGMVDMDFGSVLGFFGLIFGFCQICAAIQAANYGFGLVSIEETEWTADFLLAKPVTRTSILTAKLLAALSSLAITNAVAWGSGFFAVAAFGAGKPYDGGTLALIILTFAAVQLFFLSAGMAVSLLLKRIRSVTPLSLGLVFGLYLLNAFGGMAGKESLELISPFKHFSPSYIVANSSWNMALVPVSAAIVVVCLIVSYPLYVRRNIASAV
jgi:ABC-2 type transport system permease protein